MTFSWNKPYNENQHSDDLPVVDGDTGDVVAEPAKKKSTCYDIFSVFEEILNKNPLNWRVNKTQRISAENLHSERGVAAVKNALNFYKEHRDEEFCPTISSPYDLDSKWSKLTAYKRKIES